MSACAVPVDTGLAGVADAASSTSAAAAILGVPLNLHALKAARHGQIQAAPFAIGAAGPTAARRSCARAIEYPTPVVTGRIGTSRVSGKVRAISPDAHLLVLACVSETTATAVEWVFSRIKAHPVTLHPSARTLACLIITTHVVVKAGFRACPTELVPSAAVAGCTLSTPVTTIRRCVANSKADSWVG
jgi:hypothetical protein